MARSMVEEVRLSVGAVPSSAAALVGKQVFAALAAPRRPLRSAMGQRLYQLAQWGSVRGLGRVWWLAAAIDERRARWPACSVVQCTDVAIEVADQEGRAGASVFCEDVGDAARTEVPHLGHIEPHA